MRAIVRGLDIFAEAQHHAALTRIDDVEPRCQPDQQGQDDDQASPAGDLELTTATDARRRLVAGTPALAAEHFVQATVEVFPEFIEVRRAAGILVTTALVTPLRVIPGHPDGFPHSFEKVRHRAP